MSLLSRETTSICIEDTMAVKMEDGICFSKQKAMCCKNKAYIMYPQIKLTHVLVLAMLMWQQLIVRLCWYTHLPDRSYAILYSRALNVSLGSDQKRSPSEGRVEELCSVRQEVRHRFVQIA